MLEKLFHSSVKGKMFVPGSRHIPVNEQSFLFFILLSL